METTPLELTRVGRVPPREAASSSRATAATVVEVFPEVYLIATIVRAKNRCVLELVQPVASPSTAAAPVPAALKSGFRVPRVIQLVAEDEGVIQTVALVREPVCSVFAAALEAQEATSGGGPSSSSSSGAGGVSVHHVHVHFFIGTSNGTVLIGNALRGTILVVAQFQYHHRFDDERRGDRLTTTDTARTGETAGTDTGSEAAPQRAKVNEAVVKFVVRQRSDAQLWNPAIPYTQGVSAAGAGTASAGKRKSAQESPTAGSRLASVYVVHSGGKVVELTRAALDTCVRASIDRLDGRRPHLILEWSPDTSTAAFPIAGPASEMANLVSGVFVLAPPSTAYSSIEGGTATAKAARAETAAFSIRDADLFLQPLDDGPSPLLAPLGPQRGCAEVLLVAGTNPFFASYRLQSAPSGFSASNAVKAVKNMVTGVARSLWLSALGTTGPVERPPHLKKVAAPRKHAFLQADAKCGAVQVDATQQWAAFAVEGGGRIYIADLENGVVTGVLKGCRTAQFTWWWTETTASSGSGDGDGGGRPALLLVVYLPLRRAVEVYTARTGQRLAARHVPEGSVLLRTAGPPSETRSGALSTSVRGRQPPLGGDGAAALLMDPAGYVYRVTISWVAAAATYDPSRLSAKTCASAPAQNATSSVVSASLLRGCQTPDDFLDVALQLPLPQHHVQQDANAPSGCHITGGDAVRGFLGDLALVCNTVQRRFAPGYAEIATTPMRGGTARDILEGMTALVVPRGMTAAQCLHYIQLYAGLVENYHRLLTCKAASAAATRYFDPLQWTSALVTPDLWKATFCTAASAPAAAFTRTVEAQFTASLAAYPAEQTVYKKQLAPYLHRRMREAHTTAAAASSECLSASRMPLHVFLRCFYVGTARPTFLRGAIASAEDADGSVNFMGPLSDLVYGVRGLDGFLAQLPALHDVGCTDSDVASLSVTWVARQAGRNLAALFASTTVGCLAATLLTFSGEHFVAALERAPVPFVAVEGDVAWAAAADSVAGLLWCAAVRAALQPASSPLAERERLDRRLRQLLQLWQALRKDAAAPPTETDNAVAFSDERVALFLRLSAVEPPSVAGTAGTGEPVGDGHATVRGARSPASDGAAAGAVAAHVDGDVVEVYLQRNGFSIALLDGFAVPRGDADADAARLFPLFSAFVSLLGEAGYVSDPDAVTVEALPWIDERCWDAERFHNEAVRPLEQLWQQLTTASAGGLLGKGPARGGASAVYESCLILVTMSVLQHALRPLTDVAFFFWETNAVPDGNFFPVDGAPAGLVLSGSRTSRDYLKSLQRLASFLERIVAQTVAPLQNAERVLLLQRISLALASDDALLFPLVPNFLRVRLTIWMQVLVQTPRAPLRRARRVRQLVELLLFFSEASALTMGGVPLTQLQSQLTVPWRDLLGGPSRWVQLQLFPTGFLTNNTPPPGQSTTTAIASARRASLEALPPLPAPLPGMPRSPYAAEEEDPRGAPLDVGVAAALLRRFLAAGAAIVASQQHPPPAVTASGSVAPPPCVGLVAPDTRQSLSRLAQCLGLQESHPDIADVVLMDFEVKHLFPVAAVEQEMLLLSDKSVVPQVAATALQSLLLLTLQHVTARRRACGLRGDRAAHEAASEQLRDMVHGLSADVRSWLRERETAMASGSTPPEKKERAEPATSTATLESLFASAEWVTPQEHQDMQRLVTAALTAGRGSPVQKNFFQLLFTLSQWVCESPALLPPATRRVARELPLIAEKWERLV